MMKCFKRLVKDHVVSRPPSSICLPPKWFHRRCHLLCTTSKPDTCERREEHTRVQMLFVDFSSVTNTFIPREHLADKLVPLGLTNPVCNWLLDFHTKRPNFVQVNNNLSNVISLSTSSPQGCILNLMLFTLMTKTAVPGSLLIASKYIDNTAVVGLDWGDNDWGYWETGGYPIPLLINNTRSGK